MRETKREVMAAVEELEDIARSAMQHSDRGIAMAAVAALVDLLEDVTQMRRALTTGLVRHRRCDRAGPRLRVYGRSGYRGDRRETAAGWK